MESKRFTVISLKYEKTKSRISVKTPIKKQH
jgi:hypothetical protein